MIFVSLIGYLVYFDAIKSEDFINSPYNTRQDTFSDRIVRGSIQSSDGEVLAQTNVYEDGTEERTYPFSNIFAHAVGYDTNGKSGLESEANFQLLTSHSFFLEQMKNEFLGKKNQGDTVISSLNADLQTTAYNSLGDRRGAVVVLEPSTGRILAMVSKPDFDPNTIAADWDNLTADENTDAALLNRATQGLYPPGSTFKILTTLEYIQEHADYENYSYTCTGSYTVGNHTIHCYGNKSHGTQNLRQAFANSCNAFYASLGMELDIDQFGQLCNKMLFNTSLPTDLQASKSSFVLDKSDGSSAIMATSIGQGQTLVTPFHMALLVSAINNDGVLMKPYVLDRVESSDGTLVEQYEPEEYGTLMTTDEAAILKDYMNYVVETGTGKKLSGQSYEAAGKTGSAEYSTGADSSHSWFVGYAHRDDKSDIAIAVIVEKAGVGSEYAVPIAKEVFDAYYNE